MAEVGPAPADPVRVEETGIPLSVSSARPLTSADIQWPRAVRAAAMAGFIGALLMLTPVGALGVGMLAAGALTVALYRRSDPGIALPPAVGAKVGLLSGVFGFGFFAAFLDIQVAVLHKGDELRSALVHAIEQAASRSADPQAQAMAAWLKSPEGLVLMIALTLIFTLVVCLILSALGGALAAALARRNSKKLN